jgi:predicted dehydrogenase
MTDPSIDPQGALARLSANVLPPLRLGVIGCELGRARYGAALASLPALRVVALADSDERYPRVWAREMGGKPMICADADDLLAQPLDAVLIAAPLNERAERIASALRAGRPVLAETPFAADLTAMDDLLGLAAQNGVLLMPAVPRRFDPYFLALSRELEANSVGALQQVRCAWSFPLENVEPTADIVTGGWNAALQTLACQTVDLCLSWMGAGTAVSADIDLETISASSHPHQRRTSERTLATLLVTHAQGLATHQIARTRSVRPDERYLFTGAEGNMELVVSAGAAAATTTAPALRRQRAGQRTEAIAPEIAPTERALMPAALRMSRLLYHFARCVGMGDAPAVTGVEARAAIEIVHAAYVSTREHVKVSLPLHRAPDVGSILRSIGAAPRSLPPGK